MSRSRMVDLAFSYSLSHFYFIFDLLFNFQFLESRVRVTINQDVTGHEMREGHRRF